MGVSPSSKWNVVDRKGLCSPINRNQLVACQLLKLQIFMQHDMFADDTLILFISFSVEKTNDLL